MYRWYHLDIVRNLFGKFCLTLQWGCINKARQGKIITCENLADAEMMLSKRVCKKEKNNEEAAMSKPTKRRATPTAKTPKRLEDHKQTKPPQLSLFEMLAPEDRGYSNTIELYDFIPKYNYGKIERIGGEFLRALEREFECRGLKYTVNDESQLNSTIALPHGRILPWQ